MSENVSTNSCTRYVEIQTKFVIEILEDDFIKILFVCYEKNTSDILTKNVSGYIYQKDVNEYVVET